MPRILISMGVLVMVVLPCRGEEGADKPSETRIRLRVTPAPAPRPALRYRLFPEMAEMQPGNPIEGYYRAILAHEAFALNEGATGNGEARLATPFQAIPFADDDRGYGRHVLELADQAARLDRLDWQILSKVKTEGFSLLLPDVQQLRGLARALAARLRVEVAQGDCDGALRTAQTMFAMGRHLGDHPTLIGNLVGIAIANTAIEPLEELLQRSECPNLYWALTTLPVPLVPMVMGMEGERVLMLAEFRELETEVPMEVARIRRFVDRLESVLGGGQPVNPGMRLWHRVLVRSKFPSVVAAARRRLVEQGLPEERLQRFPPEQVILLDERRESLERFDDIVKTMQLPFDQAEALITRLPTHPKGSSLAEDFLPSTIAPRRAQARLQQRIALLRHVEALRLHAAEKGALPTRLAEVSVPLPDDPVTGKPFGYELSEGTAHLRGTPPSGAEAIQAFNLHYEVTLDK